MRMYVGGEGWGARREGERGKIRSRTELTTYSQEDVESWTIQTGRQTDRQTDRQTHRQIDRRRDRLTDGETGQYNAREEDTHGEGRNLSC